MTTRRQFLAAGLGAAALPFLSRLAWARALPARRTGSILVLVELGGGNDGLNMVVPFEDDGYRRGRPTLALPASRLLKLRDGLGLRRELAPLKERFDRGQLALLQGVGYPHPDRSHFRSTDIWHSASLEPETVRTGWIGRACECAALAKPGRSPALMVGDDKVPLLLVGDHSAAPQIEDPQRLKLPLGPDDAGAAARRSALARLTGTPSGADSTGDFLRRCARDAQATAVRIEAATAGQRCAVSYPDVALARELRLAAQLIAGGFDCSVYFVRQPGYDTHAFQADVHARLLADLGGALGAFLADVEAAGALTRVTVVVTSEFGRRVEENGSQGTDHGAAAPVLVAGGSVKGGVLNEHPSLADLEDGDLKFTLDFRRLYSSLLEDWLGVPSREVLGDGFEKLALFA